MVEADDVLAARAGLPLNTHELSRIDSIPIVQRVGALVLAAHDGLDLLHTILPDMSQQHAATLMRVALLAMPAKLFPFRFVQLQYHGWLVIRVRPRSSRSGTGRRNRERSSQ